MMSIAINSTQKPTEACHSTTAQAIHRWLRDSAGGERGLDYAVSALEWCHRLPKLADMLPATIWQRLLNHLLLTAVDAETPDSERLAESCCSTETPRHCNGGALVSRKNPLEDGLVFQPSSAETLGADSLVHQLLAGELAMTLASLFPNIKACRRLLPRARRALSAGLIDLLDGEGFLHAGRFDHVWPLLACWTRCRSLGKRWKRGCWSAEADAQYRRFVRNALRLARRDGSSVFSQEKCGDAARKGDRGDCRQEMQQEDDVFPGNLLCPLLTATLAAAVEMVGGEADHAIAAIVLSGRKNKKNRDKRGGVELPNAAIHSDRAAAAVLRPDWSRSAPRLTVLYPGASCRVEFACGKDVLWSGDWGYDLRVDGMTVAPVSDWSDTCWVSDEDVDYLELEIELVEGFRIQRHILLARKDRFLLLADAVLGPRRAALDYRSSLPLGRQITFCPASETSEGPLVGRKVRAVVIPLALPEWREKLPSPLGRGAGGEGLGEMRKRIEPISRSQVLTPAFSRKERGEALLELRQAAFGRALFAPLFLDLDRRRFGKPLTWRQLIVAESLAVQPADAAVGYRVSTGGKHWLIYRSLTPSRNRTLLGHNLSGETLIARFTRKGEVKSLIEIE